MDLKDWEDNIKNDASKNTPSNDYATTVVNFLKGFQAPAGPGEEWWDLNRGNRKHMDKESLAQFITKKRMISFSWIILNLVMNLAVIGQLF